MSSPVEKDNENSLRKEATAQLEQLLRGRTTRQDVDAWVGNLEVKYGADFMDSLNTQDKALADLIDALGLVMTPDAKGDWLYSEVDWQQWLNEFHE